MFYLKIDKLINTFKMSDLILAPIKRTKRPLFACLLMALTPFFVQASCEYAAPLSVNEFEIGNILKWATSNEQDNELFVIERSIDGINFEAIGKVKGEEYSKEYKEYQFLDMGLGNTASFYRLAQVDVDGSFNLSHILKVDRKQMNNFAVYNMNTTDVQEYFIVSLESSVIGVLEYEIIGQSNATIAEGTKVLGQDIDQLKINMKHFKVGVYKVRLQLGEEIEELIVRRTEDGFAGKNNYKVKMNK